MATYEILQNQQSNDDDPLFYLIKKPSLSQQSQNTIFKRHPDIWTSEVQRSSKLLTASKLSVPKFPTFSLSHIFSAEVTWPKFTPVNDPCWGGQEEESGEEDGRKDIGANWGIHITDGKITKRKHTSSPSTPNNSGVTTLFLSRPQSLVWENLIIVGSYKT